jgi:hypothetical protein
VDDPAMDAELEQVTSTLGAGGMLLVPQREPDMDADRAEENRPQGWRRRAARRHSHPHPPAHRGQEPAENPTAGSSRTCWLPACWPSFRAGVAEMGRSLMISVNGSAGSVQKSRPCCPAGERRGGVDEGRGKSPPLPAAYEFFMRHRVRMYVISRPFEPAARQRPGPRRRPRTPATFEGRHSPAASAAAFNRRAGRPVP